MDLATGTAVTAPAAPSAITGATERPPPALAIGLFLATSAYAFETFAVATVLPTISDEFDGDRLYGATFVVYMLANLVALVTAGERADRTGLRRSYTFGILSFAAGLVVAGTANSMGMVLAGRALQGAGTGIFATLSLVVVRRAYPEHTHRKMYAILSTGWVLPSLIAPFAAGWITDTFGWRWTFIALIPLLGVVALLVLPNLAAVDRGTTFAPAAARSRVPIAIALAAGVGTLTAASYSARWWVMLPLVAAGVAIVVPSLRRLMPKGVAHAVVGQPAAIASRMCAMFAFNSADFFIPLAADRFHDASPTVQGATILGAALSWSGAQWFAAQHGERIGSHRLVPIGFVFLGIGVLISATVLFADLPLWVTFLCWTIGGGGMGLLFNPTSHVAMGASERETAGLASTQLAVADVFGFVSMAAFGGALVSLADQTSLQLGPALATVFVTGATVSVVGAVAGRNVR
jgi:MFS family permease